LYSLSLTQLVAFFPGFDTWARNLSSLSANPSCQRHCMVRQDELKG
jgi:hypothetical protein